MKTGFRREPGFAVSVAAGLAVAVSRAVIGSLLSARGAASAFIEGICETLAASATACRRGSAAWSSRAVP
ncbi:MAG TPA: hypothetical protein VFX03_11790, partial [Thermomicrobiales bacterium]|nr:hypothetical protein [Thermomicrobiales bacterium]